MNLTTCSACKLQLSAVVDRPYLNIKPASHNHHDHYHECDPPHNKDISTGFNQTATDTTKSDLDQYTTFKSNANDSCPTPPAASHDAKPQPYYSTTKGFLESNPGRSPARVFLSAKIRVQLHEVIHQIYSKDTRGGMCVRLAEKVVLKHSPP